MSRSGTYSIRNLIEIRMNDDVKGRHRSKNKFLNLLIYVIEEVTWILKREFPVWLEIEGGGEGDG